MLALVVMGARFAAAAPGESLAEPVLLGEEGVAGTLRISVLEVVTGQAATDLVVGAGSGNSGPRAGVTYVAVRLRITNDGVRPVTIDGNDFALIGASREIRRFLGVAPPDPAIDGAIAPGDAKDGWVVLSASSDDSNLLMLFDSLALPGRWADRAFALEADAAIDDEVSSFDADDIAIDPGDPVGVGGSFATDLWSVELLEIATCLEVFELSDFRVQALGTGDAIDEAPWIALRLGVSYNATSAEIGFWSPTAFMLVNGDGNTINDVITLTPPSPDASGYYAPGSSREGWISIEIPENYMASGLSLVRFLPHRDDGDARYLTYAEEMPVC